MARAEGWFDVSTLKEPYRIEGKKTMGLELAEQLGADYGVAITGFAGPTGGNGDNPIGTIFVGIHSPGGDWAKKLTYPGPRCTVKQRAVTAAIDWLRREVLRESRKAVAPLVN